MGRQEGEGEGEEHEAGEAEAAGVLQEGPGVAEAANHVNSETYSFRRLYLWLKSDLEEKGKTPFSHPSAAEIIYFYSIACKFFLNQKLIILLMAGQTLFTFPFMPTF